MSDVKSTVEAWEASVETLSISTRALVATIKMLQESRSNAMMTKSWDAVDATRQALLAAQFDEASKFEKVVDHQRQGALDLDGANSSPRGEGAPAAPGLKLLPQEKIELDPNDTEGERQGAAEDDDGEDPDSIVDEDEEEAGTPVGAKDDE